jgi:uncharacterized protein (DUF1778 family)
MPVSASTYLGTPDGYIERAACLHGRSLTDFVIGSLEKSARETLGDHEVLTLSIQDSRIFTEALIHPPQPNAALKRAFALHKKTVKMR